MYCIRYHAQYMDGGSLGGVLMLGDKNESSSMQDVCHIHLNKATQPGFSQPCLMLLHSLPSDCCCMHIPQRGRPLWIKHPPVPWWKNIYPFCWIQYWERVEWFHADSAFLRQAHQLLRTGDGKPDHSHSLVFHFCKLQCAFGRGCTAPSACLLSY